MILYLNGRTSDESSRKMPAFGLGNIKIFGPVLCLPCGNHCYKSCTHHTNLKKAKVTQPAHEVPRTSPEGPLKILTSGTYRGPSGDPRGTNTKTDDLMKKLFFRRNSPCITYLFLFFYRKNKYSKVCGTSRDPVTGRPEDQMMGRFRDVRGTSVKHVL